MEKIKIMNFEKIEIEKEQERKPEKLYRAFTINPEELSLEKLREDLVPGNVNEKDPTKIGDGNELGVYMSTNQLMVEKNYSYGTNGIEAPKHSIQYGGQMAYIKLPTCGIVYEIDTNGIDIRKPQIRPELQGVYNNEFEGDEWIADKVPGKNCKVNKLILSVYANDQKRVELDVSGMDEQELQKAINLIKEKFDEKKAEALKFKEFLEGLSERERLANYMSLNAKYDNYLKGSQKN